MPGLPCRPHRGTATLSTSWRLRASRPSGLPSAWAAGHPHRAGTELMAMARMGLLSGDQGPKADGAALASGRGAHRRGALATGPPCPQSPSLQLPRGQRGARDCRPWPLCHGSPRPLEIGLTLPSPPVARAPTPWVLRGPRPGWPAWGTFPHAWLRASVSLTTEVVVFPEGAFGGLGVTLPPASFLLPQSSEASSETSPVQCWGEMG